MSYKDKVRQKEYQREWARRKRKNLPTRIVNKPKTSKQERNKKKQEKARLNMLNLRKKRAERKALIKETFGDECFICKTSKDNQIICLHKKDGKKHKCFYDISNKNFDNLLKSKKYVMLCYPCHRHVHWCMKMFNFTWLDIEKHSKEPVA